MSLIDNAVHVGGRRAASLEDNFELAREVIGFQRATHSLLHMMTAIEDGFEKYGVTPEQQWRFGYLLAIVAMALTSASLYLVFKRRRWLCRGRGWIG